MFYDCIIIFNHIERFILLKFKIVLLFQILKKYIGTDYRLDQFMDSGKSKSESFNSIFSTILLLK